MHVRQKLLSRTRVQVTALLGMTIMAGLLLAPAVAPAATKAPAKPPAKVPAAKAPAASWVKIQTPVRMKAAKKLRYRIFCREACKLSVTTKLKWPGRPNLVTTIKGSFNAGESRANILTLNNPARNTLKANWRRTIMQVIVRARNMDTGVRRTVKKSVRFKK